jgi:V8-like Glu-specific endopeptidase
LALHLLDPIEERTHFQARFLRLNRLAMLNVRKITVDLKTSRPVKIPFMFGVLLAVAGCGHPGPGDAPVGLELGQQHQAIRNGTREPQVLTLTGAQKMAVGWLHPRGRPSSNFCTATLVAPRVVATARHCTESQQGGIAFGIGLLPSNAAASFNVASVHQHPSVDAAILILDQDATQAGISIHPIPFNRLNLDASIEGRDVEAAGYGETYDRTRSGRYFAVVQLRDVRNSEIVVDGRGRQGICFGDSGGPVMTEDADGQVTVLAVESWGEPSCLGVDHLTRLDAIQDWIDEITGGPAMDPIDEECRRLGFAGSCDGSVLNWCQDGEIQSKDCADEGERCEYVDDRTGYNCVEPDPCETVGSVGICDGDMVVRCRFGEIVSVNCSDEDKTCLSDAGGAYCADVEPDEPETEDPPADETPEPENSDPMDIPPMEDLDEPASPDGELKRGGGGCQTTPGSNAPPPWLLLLLIPLALRPRAKPSIARG